METVTLARNAMATRFELVLHGPSARALRSAGEEALAEIDRIESQLSLYRSTSEIFRINALAAREPVRVSPGVFRLLEQARELSRATVGAFDLTIAPLVRCWGFMDNAGRMPDPTALAAACDSVGMEFVTLDESNHTVRFLRPGMMLDFGAIGKGYALERAAELLREAGITSALLHGGTSTVYGLGHPPEAPSWKVALESFPGANPSSLAVVALRDNALSVSAVWGRSFNSENKTFGHVIDPLTGAPVTGHLLAAIVLPSATETDALSTALLVRGEAILDQLAARWPRIGTALLLGELDDLQSHRFLQNRLA